MAHRRIKVKTLPYITRDGKVSPKKRKHTVTCRSHGKLCFEHTYESRAEAEKRAEMHRELHRSMHSWDHPNDLEAKQHATPRQVANRPTFKTIQGDIRATRAYEKVTA